jgi:hypothetical protein
MKYFAGIGSRDTPYAICDIFTELTGELYAKGFNLRSGHALGADIAFERGSVDPENDQIFVPKAGYKGSTSIYTGPTDEAIEIAKKFHPKWSALRSHEARMLMARNTHQILGPNCDVADISEMVICWTPDGAETKTSRETGGSGQAIRIANAYKVPVFNFANKDAYDRLMHYIDIFHAND